jgi:hypothetical protein
MSLINDALKRARDAEKNRAPAPPHPPLAPTDTPPRQDPAARRLLLTLVLGAILLSAASFWKWAHHDTGTSQASQLSPTPNPTMAFLPDPAPAPPQSVNPVDSFNSFADPGESIQPDPSESSPSIAKSDPLLEPDADPGSADLADVPVPDEQPASLEKEPELRLQSIIFRPGNPAVLINNQMLHRGDPIAGGIVTDIQLQAVTVLRGESNIVLKLPSF